jgi:Cu-processing system permease protein
MRAIARKEFRDAMRNHWLQGYAVLLGLLGVVVAMAATRGAAGLGLQSFGRTAASLSNLCLLLAPLVTLALAAATIAGERDRGTLERLLAQPLERSDLLLGKALGLAASLVAATLAGFLPAAVVLAGVAGPALMLRYAIFPVLAILVIGALLGVGMLVSVRSHSGGQAQARAVFLWFAFVMLYDLLIMGTLLAASIPASALAGLLLLNPVSAGRLLVVLALEGDLYLMGPAGAWLVETMSTAGTAMLLVGSLVAWATISLLLALRYFRRPRSEAAPSRISLLLRRLVRRSAPGKRPAADPSKLERVRT